MAGEVLLRNVARSDLPLFFEHQLDPLATRMAAFSPRDRSAFDEHWARILADEAITKRTILFDGVVVGNIVCFERDDRWEVGYWIGREHWGRGIASRALAEFLRVVSRRPLTAVVACHNIASLRVLEKNGFTVSGRLHPAFDSRGPDVEEYVLTLT